MQSYYVNEYDLKNRKTLSFKYACGYSNVVIQCRPHLKEYDEINSNIIIENEEAIFNNLASQWRRETRGVSMMIYKTILNDAYLNIIGMGKSVTKYILLDLKKKPDHWFVALEKIEKVNPIPENDMGNIIKMTEAWINWGKENGKI